MSMSKNIMFQGTGSTVGKSLLCAALCRILNDEGFRVKPFKSQNMALNSYITKDGKEMGRAQVVQAEAARIEPMVEMNPILLKPTSDVGSQVILQGQVYCNKNAIEYHELKKELRNVVLQSYNKLSKTSDIIVLEGAGSPAEINLRDNDLVNMGMAEMVDAPVILVGDIDKGGVFASLYGTVELLYPEEKARVKGFIINKFRGDVSLLKPGIDMIEEKMGIKCLGVIPYFEHNIDDEDSVTDRFSKNSIGKIVVGVIKLPYMSNFTDFTVFELEKDIELRYIYNSADLINVDLIIIPGSKNTIKDLKYMVEKKLDVAIKLLSNDGIPIVGICGGYQILGKKIIDNNLVESVITESKGLGLLDVNTSMEIEKTTTQISGEILTNLPFVDNISGTSITGYEIHMGVTELSNSCKPFIKLEDGRFDGAINDSGLVFGSYLHGIFDNDCFRNSLIKYLREKKDISVSEQFSYSDMKEKEYNKLAKIVRDNINLDHIMQIINSEL